MFTKEGAWPGIQYPGVPRHEVAGLVDEVGRPVSPTRRRDNAWESAGTAATTARVSRAGSEISQLPESTNSGISYDGGIARRKVWLARQDLTTFKSWFEVTIHSTIVDLADDVLEQEEL